jgi:hypothetical protein
VLDLELLVKDRDGTVRKADLHELEVRAGLALEIWERADFGLLDWVDPRWLTPTVPRAPGTYRSLVPPLVSGVQLRGSARAGQGYLHPCNRAG